jgi:hypothetical protein
MPHSHAERASARRPAGLNICKELFAIGAGAHDDGFASVIRISET